MKGEFPQRVQLSTRAWDRPFAAGAPVPRAAHPRQAPGAAVAPVATHPAKPPHPPSDIRKELTKLFRRL